MEKSVKEKKASQKVLQRDNEYRTEMDEAGKRYMQRLEEADKLMQSIPADEFIRGIRSGDDSLGPMHSYEKLAGQELDLSNHLAAVRLAMRLMLHSGGKLFS